MTPEQAKTLLMSVASRRTESPAAAPAEPIPAPAEVERATPVATPPPAVTSGAVAAAAAFVSPRAAGEYASHLSFACDAWVFPHSLLVIAAPASASKAMETARAALEWYEKSVAARRMETLGVLGSTAPPTPAAVQLLKLESQQRVRDAPVAPAATKDLAGELAAFESLVAPIAASAAATEVHTGFQDDENDDSDSDSDGEDAVAMLKARKAAAPAPAPGAATKAAAKSKGASAKSLAMAEKLDALSAEHSKLKSELAGKP